MDFICQVCKKAKKYGVLVILSCNRGEDITPEIGTLATCVMLTENDNKYDRKELFASFGKIFKTDRVFYKCFDYLTEDNNVMVLCENNSDDLQSQVYWYPLEGTPKDSDTPLKEENDTKDENAQQHDDVKDSPNKEPSIRHDSENPDEEASTKNDESSGTKNEDDKYEERDTCNIM